MARASLRSGYVCASVAVTQEVFSCRPTEPEAAVQPRKDGVRRPSYKPIVMVHESGLIVGQHVDPSSEREALKPMLDQHAGSLGQMPPTLLLDAGFASFPTLALIVEHNVGVLCPTGQATPEDNWQRRAGRGGRFSKQAFEYIPERDIYRCPWRTQLVYEDQHVDTFGRRYWRYRGTRCGDGQLCKHRRGARYGRPLKRYEATNSRRRWRESWTNPLAPSINTAERSSSPVSPNCASTKASGTFTVTDSLPCASSSHPTV